MLTSKVALGIAAGVCGTLFLGYCVYFDHLRHSDPEFKRKLRERRRAKQEAALSRKPTNTTFPDMKNREAVQRFFLQEIQLGEEFITLGDIETGVDHIANAVSVCGQPNDLLNLLQQTLQPQAFHLLIQRVANIAPRLVKAGPSMEEEDVE